MGQVFRSHKLGKLVYNCAMPIPASLIASIVSAIIETAAQNSAVDPAQYETYVSQRTLPPEAKQGIMYPPPGDGKVVIGGQSLVLSPVAQFRNQQNLIVMPMAIQRNQDVVYITDTFGAVSRVWLISAAENSALQQN